MTNLPFRLRLLGRVELRDPKGDARPLPPRPTVLLLALLAVTGDEGGTRGDLAGTVWERSDPRAARDSLRTALSALRRLLPADAIRIEGDRVWLDSNIVALERGEGEFMPGFENDWAVGQRLRFRAEAVSAALAASRAAHAAGRNEEALALSKRAAAIDPLDSKAAEWVAERLTAEGRPIEAVAQRTTFRSRTIRELGYLPELEPSSTPENPLIGAVEWALERDPDEACAILAATQGQWLGFSIDQALNVHRRVLAGTHRPSPERSLVEAGAWFLASSAGGLVEELPKLDAQYRTAQFGGERAAASRLCETLAYAHLSRGDFDVALSYARENLGTARARHEAVGDPLAVAEAEMNYGIVEIQLGRRESGHRWLATARRRMEEHGSPRAALTALDLDMAARIDRGQFDRAAELLDRCRRLASTFGYARMMPWFFHAEACIHEGLGDLAAARKAYERLRTMAKDAGQAATGTADDGLMRINGKLGLYDEAAQAWVRVAAYRRSKRSVPSPYEREVARPVVRKLRERFDPRELAARVEIV